MDKGEKDLHMPYKVGLVCHKMMPWYQARWVHGSYLNIRVLISVLVDIFGFHLSREHRALLESAKDKTLSLLFPM